ncbi:MAG: glycosyltransferase family 2 protein [candidate division KSB1 bacterium]|nr:glycosyltransferase family 2 protein [candidate division KSB1 bacterium]MDZ7398820.1 glycosyltransferase family 2 protein [candidate division KSB1 bacterium]
MEHKIEISLVVPLYNEEENVRLLHEKIREVLDGLGKNYEIIFVDDGSRDKTFEHLKGIHDENPRAKIIKFRGNFGQSAAMAAGFEAAKGEFVFAMDGDLQNDPKDIPRLLEKLQEGYDVVSGWRKNRKDKLVIRKIPSRIANKLICIVTGVRLHDTGCSLKAFRSEIIKRIRLYGELHRFIPALAKIEGARITEMVVAHHARKFGKSKYNITRTFRVIVDLMAMNLFIKYLKMPLRFFGKIGTWFLVGGFVSIIWILYRVYLFNKPLVDVNILLTSVFLFIATGAQFFVWGLLADLIVKTGKRKSIYLTQSPSFGAESRSNLS